MAGRALPKYEELKRLMRSMERTQQQPSWQPQRDTMPRDVFAPALFGRLHTRNRFRHLFDNGINYRFLMFGHNASTYTDLDAKFG